MEKSIESIWKKGFLKEDALIAPKVTNLYQQKSKSIVEKMQRMFVLNFYYIIGLAAFFLAGSFLLKAPIPGIFVTSLFVVIIYMGYHENKKMIRIDQSVNSFQYLKDFDLWRKNAISAYGKLYAFFYPLFFLGLIVAIWQSPILNKPLRHIMANHPDMKLLYGIPIYWLIIAGTVVLLSAMFSQKLYQLDLNLVYGRVFKKLDEIIQDIETLSNE